MSQETAAIGCYVQVSERPHDYMEAFDSMPKHIRNRINQSDFKLCTMCLFQIYNLRGAVATLEHINDMERQIRQDSPLKINRVPEEGMEAYEYERMRIREREEERRWEREQRRREEESYYRGVEVRIPKVKPVEWEPIDSYIDSSVKWEPLDFEVFEERKFEKKSPFSPKGARK